MENVIYLKLFILVVIINAMLLILTPQSLEEIFKGKWILGLVTYTILNIFGLFFLLIFLFGG